MFQIFILTLVAALGALSTAAFAQNAPNPDILATLKPTHPRLIASAASWDEIRAQRARDPQLDAVLKRQELEARALLNEPPLTYKKEGRRLLSVSRAVLRRVALLASQAKITGNRAFAERAASEMLAVCAFDDWNPSHFLDVAEMTAGLALGLDWLHDELEPAARQTIARAIADKGLRAGIAAPGWMKATHNWNSVCHGGLVLGALAIAEIEPQLAAQTLQNAKNFNHFGLEPYAPSGIYPEGASYWNYGTSFQVMLLASLESALGTDWNLGQSPGFMASAGVLEQTKGPSDTFFNFFDGNEKAGLDSTFFWFAKRLQSPALLASQRPYLKAYAAQTRLPIAESQNNRLLPLAALWWPENGLQNAPAEAKPPKFWLGRGENPLASFRDRWDDSQAMFLALKGGRAALNHGHMDAGSFVFESDGVRWARDLGMQDYLSLESKGIKLWNTAQNGGRWSVFRLNNFSHNTLTINDQLHQVNGQAEITHFSDSAQNAGAIVDLTPTFAGQATRVTRGFAFRTGSHMMIRDEIEGLKAGDVVRFAMLTRAQITLTDGSNEAVLKENGKTLRVFLQGIEGVKWEVISADPPRDFDAPNPDLRFLIARFVAPAAGKIAYAVKLQPATATATDDELAGRELKSWPLSAVK